MGPVLLLLTGSVVALLLLTACWAVTGGPGSADAPRSESDQAPPSGAIRISNDPQLLLDNHLVERYEALTRTIHQPRMHPANPVLSPQEPWEYGAILLWGTVIFDQQEHIFKMWYMGWGNEAGGALPGWRTPLCYAVSFDGVQWRRPKLSLYQFRYRDRQSPDGPPRECPVNNIVFNDDTSVDGMDSPTVAKDLADPDPSRRYKMCYWHRLSTGTGIYNAYSADGIHWTHIPKMLINAGDRNTFHFDPFCGKWIVVTRPDASFYLLEQFGEPNEDKTRTVVQMEPRDAEQFPDRFLYSMPVFNYGAMQIGLPEFYSRKVNRWVSYLAWSHDGVHWTIDPDRVPYMPWNDTPGTFDCWRRNIHNGGVIRRGDELWLYFSGRSQGKDIEGCPGYLVPSGLPGFDPRGIIASVGIGILRVDGFCSRDADQGGGSLVTRPITFDATRLKINVLVRPGGSVRAGFLDADCRPIRGFALADCDPLRGDSVALEVSWHGRNDIKALSGRPVRLQLAMQAAELYSFSLIGP